MRGAVWVLRDDTQQRARQREARHLAEIDPLTELSNRRGFEVHLQQAITRVERTGQAASLMYIDLDRFKPSTTPGAIWPAMPCYGRWPACCAMACAIRTWWRGWAVTNSRSSCPVCTPRRAARIGGELLHTLAALSIPWDQDRLRIGASIGIAPLAGGMSVDQAVAAADAQCYRAKAMGRNNVQVQGELSQLPVTIPTPRRTDLSL